VDRNYIRRRMREAYRLHKHLLPRSSEGQGHFLLAYVYMANPGPVDYATLCSRVVAGINALCAHYEKCRDKHSLGKS
jgi:ribonuclease P protein component